MYYGDVDSSVNQKIKKEFVRREVLCCVTSLVDFVLSCEDENVPFTWDDVQSDGNMPQCESCDSCDFEDVYPTDRSVEIEADLLADPSEKFICPVCNSFHGTEIEARECCGYMPLHRCSDCGKVYNDDQFEELFDDCREVFEWWIVTPWLASKLAERGEKVIDGEKIWGRCTTGQSVEMDNVISTICADIGILNGQEHDWSRRDA